MMKYMMFLILIAFIAVGCDDSGTQKDSNNKEATTQKLATQYQFDQDASQNIKKTLMSKKEITDVKAVNTNETILVAVEIKHMERFQLKKIEKKFKKQLKKQYPKKEITLSLDKKIYLETTKMEQKVSNKEISKDKIEKEIKRIIELSNEKT